MKRFSTDRRLPAAVLPACGMCTWERRWSFVLLAFGGLRLRADLGLGLRLHFVGLRLCLNQFDLYP